MKIYKSEKSIESLILSSTKSCMAMDAQLLEEKPADVSMASLLDGLSKREAKVDLPENMHPDLLYGSSVLVSTNMNKNHDIFLPEETFKAKDTPVNTPFNIDHESSDIIGHIISAKAVDKDDNVLESLPSSDTAFDIQVGFVIYKFIYPKASSQIVSLATIDKQFVSMECMFADFDYGLVDSEGAISIVERNEDTAFLTKKLKIFGGSGKYEDKTVGRVLKDIRFVGMGSVETPANPDSEFLEFKVVAKEKSLYDNEGKHTNIDNTYLMITSKGNVMKIENLDQAQTLIEKLEQEKAALKTELETVKTEKSEADSKITELESEKQDLETKVEANKDKIEQEEQKVTLAEQKIEDLTKNLDESKTAADESDKELAETKAKLEEFEQEKLVTARVTELEGLGFKVDDDKKEELKTMSDDAYANIVEWINSMPKSNDDNKDDDNDNKADASVLDDVKSDDNSTDLVDGDDVDDQNDIKSIATELVTVLMAKGKKEVK